MHVCGYVSVSLSVSLSLSTSVCVCVYQKRGDPCAAKIFAAAETANKVRVKQNELEFMRMLHHPNIVRFFAIEEEARCIYCDLLTENDSVELSC